jgi:hypothetical protein
LRAECTGKTFGAAQQESKMPVPFSVVFANWSAALALWALPYLTLRHQLGLETSDALQWSVLAVAVIGSGRVFHLAWQASREPAWRAAHGLLGRPNSRLTR